MQNFMRCLYFDDFDLLGWFLKWKLRYIYRRVYHIYDILFLVISHYDITKRDIEGDGLKKTEQLTDSMFYIMAALTKPRHGYAIMSLIEE